MEGKLAVVRERLRVRRAHAVRIEKLRDSGIVASSVALFVILAISSDVFMTQRNLLNILEQWSGLGIMACGMTLVLVAGGFDLSSGAVYALAGVIAAKAALEVGATGGLLLGCLAGLAVGLINGGLITVGRINPFVATLATGIMIGGVSLSLTGGFLVTVDSDAFRTIGRGEVFGAKYSVYIFAGVIVITALLLHLTTFGRYVYAVGGNAEAARLSGIRVGLVRTATYGLMGLCTGIAGMIAASRVGTGQADAGGFGLLFDVFTAVIVGGTSIMGGVGAIWRTVLGVLLLAMIGNGFNLLNVDIVYQRIIFGAIILSAVGLDAWSRRTAE